MIKFLKRFKEKILIALACSFIGIGTLLNNTIDTKAYTTNQFTNTLTTEIHNNTTYYKVNPNFEYTIYNFLLINFTSSVSGNWTMDLNLYDSNYNRLSFNRLNVYNVANGISFYYFIQDLSSYYCFNLSSAASNFTIVNLDYVNSNDLSTSYYAQTYIDNYTILQSQYDSLLLDYQSYQNTHAYTNDQYNNLMTQNATLTQQVQSLQSQYDTYVSLHSYTNEQYEILLANYNTLQNMYSNLQSSYLSLQQQYEQFALSVAPFTSSKWNNRTGSLNGVTYDLQNEYRDSLVSFEKTYLFVYPRDSDVFDSFSDSTNTFVLTAYCNDVVTLSSFNVIANLSHLREEYFQIDFYLDNSLVYSTIDFDNDMGEDDSNTISVDRFLQFNQITVTVVFTGVDSTIYGPGSYFNAVVGTWQNGYDYAVGQLMPQINQLEQDLQQSNAQQQVKYNEGFNAGFDSRIIHNLYME